MARLAGDEFTVLLTNLTDEESGMLTAARIAESIVGSMIRTFEVMGNEVLLSCSVGIAMFPRDGAKAKDLLRNAVRCATGSSTSTGSRS